MAPIHNFAPVSTRYPGGCWPTPTQTLLLRACLLDPPAAVQAWERWVRTHDFEAIDSGSFRLLGLAYRQLARAGVASPLMPRLHGAYRRFWTANRLLLGRNTPLLASLADAGIPVMLTKGAALTVSVYRDYGTRPMEDLDLMVPRSHALRAMEVLRQWGWVPEVHHSTELPQTLHACHFRRDGLGIIDLHWRPFHLAVTEDFERTTWERSVTCSFHGFEARVPDHSDQFLRACEHGVRYNIVPPFRWLADCLLLWRASAGRLDWDRIAAGARLTESVLAVRGTLKFLREQLDVPLPAEACARLERTTVTWHERVESRLVRRPCRSLWDKLPVDICWHLRSTRDRPWRERIAGFPTYFRHANNLAPGQFTAHYTAQLSRWWRVWLPYHVRRLPRLLASKRRTGVATFPDDALRGFHDVEPFRGRLLRWSSTTASIDLGLPPARTLEIRLDTGGLRSRAQDLAKHAAFAIDDRPIPPAHVIGKRRTLILRVSDMPAPVEAAREARLSWTCDPVGFPGDPRQLGIPLFAVTVNVVEPHEPPHAA
jgi:hypothetical protein